MTEPADRADVDDGDGRAPSARRSVYVRLLMTAVAALVVWRVLPGVPRDQTVVFALGDGSRRVAQLDVQWERRGTEHVGQLTLNFPRSAPAGTAGAGEATSAQAPSLHDTPARIVRQLRLAEGEYDFHVSARLGAVGGERTEVTRRVTLEGNTVTLRLEELTR